MNSSLVLNLGSLNVDRVLRVAQIARPGETIAASALREFAGGKGANQSVALARAGARVMHIGQVGSDGLWLRDRLASEGVDVEHVSVGSGPSGQAIIQVDDAGQNAIVILAGANAEITPGQIDAALRAAPPDSWLLVQNETSGVAYALAQAKRLGLQVAFNPAPFDKRVASYPLDCIDLLCVNQTEYEAMRAQLDKLRPDCELLLTLGERGVVRKTAAGETHHPAVPVRAVDTTAAGDTLLGYYLAGLTLGLSAEQSLAGACHAAAICVTREGALDSIPSAAELPSYRPS